MCISIAKLQYFTVVSLGTTGVSSLMMAFKSEHVGANEE
jgi:hypothetical protein